MRANIVSTLSFIRVACLAAGLGAITLLGAPDAATAATFEADVVQQADKLSNGTPFVLALQKDLPADRTGSGSENKTIIPAIKLAHCCHAHPIRPYDAYCCHGGGGGVVVVVPRYGYGAVGVRGVSRRTSRRTTRRTTNRVNHRRRR
jgi:hypothetical protein